MCISAQQVHSIQSESRHLFAAGTSACVGKIRTGMVLGLKSTAVNICHKWFEELNFLKGLDSRGHFKSVFISFTRRALFKGYMKIPKF